ncbi:Uncharacterised protein [Moraxella equi]|uniref:Uncharacterized protein n=1 Tax=Moraxella equi TaxID=60442 RepID=A0A378UTX9_9GAMM|nr:Uncharacterised protein [Moraxella equi]
MPIEYRILGLFVVGTIKLFRSDETARNFLRLAICSLMNFKIYNPQFAGNFGRKPKI